jgi:hypothetical protein
MIINKKWEKITFKSQETLREAIFNHIVMKHNEYPKFMISKMIKLLVDIARNDWPLRYPNFIEHIARVNEQYKFIYNIYLYKLFNKL